MDILFLHQNIPGQYKHLAPALAAGGRNNVVFVTKRQAVELPGVRTVRYKEPRAASRETHHYLALAENAVRHGQAAARCCLDLRAEGFRPSIIIAHPGWGEALFVKDVWPQAPLLTYAEFYYHGTGADIGFDPADPPTLDAVCRARLRNTHLLLSLDAATAAVSPTEWQRSRHPRAYQPKIRTIFDGIDTRIVRPDPAARFTLPDGRVLTRGDEVLTYVARNLEPYRGFPQMMRALPEILAARPDAQVVMVGGDEVSYGKPPEGGGSWREAMLAQVPLGDLAGRVHFTGKLPYAAYLSLLQVSSVHLYLTYPFVLSWSCFEAMAAGCLIVASETAPVAEVITDGWNGLTVPFFDSAAIARRVVEALAGRADADRLRAEARRTVVERYDLQHCLHEQIGLVHALTGQFAKPATGASAAA